MFGPDEGLGVLASVMLRLTAVCSRHRFEYAAFQPTRVTGKTLDGVRPDEVGVKWKVKRGCRVSHSRTLGC